MSAPSSSSRVVRVLYQSLLLSTRQLERDLDVGNTLFHAIRSGATDSYTGVQRDWQRERAFAARFADMRALHASFHKRTSVALVRTQFHAPLSEQHDVQRAVSDRIDAGFAALHDVDDHNALIRDLSARGAFQPKRRSDAVQFVVGDVVHVDGVGPSVVAGWTLARSHAFADVRVTYDVLPQVATSQRDDDDASSLLRLRRVSQEDIQALDAPIKVHNRLLLVLFDGFDGRRYKLSPSLARRYPDDAALQPQASQSNQALPVAAAPSILTLQSANEASLLAFLQSDDATIVTFATAALEGKWRSATTSQEAHERVQDALDAIDAGAFALARELLEHVVTNDDPKYAFAWTKLGLATFRLGETDAAMRQYATALEQNPTLLEALVGLGTCATKLQHWDVAHRAAVALERLQPGNDIARVLLEHAILSSL